jgi:hypothetical protein
MFRINRKTWSLPRAACVSIFVLLCGCSSADDLKDFTTDGCSSFPDGTIRQDALWKYCCVVHDYSYWQGGSYEDRKMADQALQHCVAQVGEPEISRLMLAGVRVGGTPYLPTKFRWGYGWSWPRGYKPLNEDEKSRVAKKATAALEVVKAEAIKHGFGNNPD